MVKITDPIPSIHIEYKVYFYYSMKSISINGSQSLSNTPETNGLGGLYVKVDLFKLWHT